MYSVRLTPYPDQWENTIPLLREYLSKYAGSYYFADEYANNRHFQGWMIITGESTKPQVNKNIRNKLGHTIPKGNKGASITYAEFPEALQEYCAKGEGPDDGPKTIMYCGIKINDDVIQKWSVDYCIHYEERAKQAREEHVSLRKELKEYADTLTVDGYYRKKIAKKYVELCVEFEKPINVFYGRTVVNLACARACPDMADEIAQEIENKM